jgi:hypothetical protein
MLPFHLEYLGFTFDREHQFEPGLPPYAQISRPEAALHPSEHHGDGSQLAWSGFRCVTSPRCMRSFALRLQHQPAEGQPR